MSSWLDREEEEEKTVLLALALGWSIVEHAVHFDEFYVHPDSSNDDHIENIYHPSNMALALQAAREVGSMGYDDLITIWFCNNYILLDDEMQAKLLDKLLELVGKSWQPLTQQT